MPEKNNGVKHGGLELREREWGLRLAFLTMAYLLFESLTGLAI